MATSPFDTLKMVERLKSVGVASEQAKMQTLLLAEVMSSIDLSNAERFASKQDVLLEIASIKAELLRIETKFDAKIEKTAADLKSELIRWVVSVGILQMALIAGLVLKLAH